LSDATWMAIFLMCYLGSLAMIWNIFSFPVWLNITLSFWPLFFLVIAIFGFRLLGKLFPNWFGLSKEERKEMETWNQLFQVKCHEYGVSDDIDCWTDDDWDRLGWLFCGEDDPDDSPNVS